MKRLRTPMPPVARALAAVLAAGCLGAAALHARTLPPQAPNPGLEAAVRAADAIAEIEVLSGGPFHAAALVKRTIKGSLPRVVELEGFNSINGNTVQNGFAAGRTCIVFLSETGRPGVYAPLTPTTPRMGLSADGVELVMGDPPFSIPVRAQALQDGLALLLERDAAGALPDRAAGFLKDAWERPEIESRYFAVAFAGYLRDPRAVPWVTQASGDKLLRLRLSAIDALKRIASPEAVEALRGLLKDERASVAQAAAEALLDLQNPAALEDLLAWAQRTSLELNRMLANDARRARPLAAIGKVLNFSDECGALIPPERICPALLDLARQKEVDVDVAAGALYVYGSLAQAPQMDALIELADDPVYPHRAVAASTLSRASMRATSNLEAFRAWWKDARGAFGEGLRRQVTESAAKSLADETDPDLHASLGAILRLAPQPLALGAAAPMLLDDKKSARLATAELLYTRSPLALPFLLERSSWGTDLERMYALDGIARICAKFPRLRDLSRRLGRAAYCDHNANVRRNGVRTAGLLEDPRGMRALLESIRDSGTYEADDAAASIFRITARTLGFGVYEPYADQELAALRLAEWWRTVERNAKTPYVSPLAIQPAFAAPEGEARTALEKLLFAVESRPAAAAFAELFRVLPAGDPMWKRLLASEHRSQRAYALLGLNGAPGEAVADVAKHLSPDQEPEALVRAHALFALASLQGGKGGEALVAWFKATAGLAWRRLAVMCMAQTDGDPATLALLNSLLEKALAAEGTPVPVKVEDDGSASAVPADLQLLRAVLYVLAARDDGTPGLLKALDLKNLELREFALRAVAQRRPPQCAAAVLTALSGFERIDVPDLAQIFEPVFGTEHVPMLRELLAKGNDAGRVAAASILAQRPDLAGDAATLKALVSACSDLSSLVRARAAKTLGRARHAEALPDLTALLLDTDPETCANAAEAVARIGDREACARAVVASTRAYRRDLRWFRAIGLAAGETEVEALIKLTASDVWTDRLAGIAGLTASERPEALARLLEIFHDADSPLRTLAFRALPEQGEAAVKGLAPDLQDPKPAVRAQALHVLGHLPLPSSAKRLLQALDDEDPGVRGMADWGLRSITGKDAGYDPAGEPAARAEASNRWRGLLPAALRAP